MSRKRSNSGEVLLIGAGPGDPELLTLKALRALETADVILFDDLVNRPILNLASRGATCICVGKRAGRPSWGQNDINRLMVRLAESGKRIVRLKSGDPTIFGRAGEEISALAAADIKVSIVPGITAASALAASLGISMTHRACAQSVRFITAHSALGGLPLDIDWHGLADSKTTLVVYMGKKTGAELSTRLIQQGRAPSTPLVVIGNVSRETEAFEVGTLSDLAEILADWDQEGPVTIAIGEVFSGLSASVGKASDVRVGMDAERLLVGNERC